MSQILLRSLVAVRSSQPSCDHTRSVKTERASPGLFGAAPSVALATLGLTVATDQPQPIRQQKIERHLPMMGRRATRERYARALERFLGKHPGKKYPHDFLRPVINDYVQIRFAEGASIATIRVELSAIRSFRKFMADVEATPRVSFVGRGKDYLKFMCVQIGLEDVRFERRSEVRDHRVAPHPH